MDWTLELVVVPVTDIDRAKQFYVEQLGWELQVDHSAGDAFRVVQVSPPGSGCSIAFGTMDAGMAPGSLHGLHVIVPDIEAACAQLEASGVEVGPVHHYVDGAQTAGVHPGRGMYESFSSFSDPDGNSFVLHEVNRETGP